MPLEFLNAALARTKLDRRVLSLLLGAGATRLHVYDFWELCHWQGLSLVHFSAQRKHLVWDTVGNSCGSVAKDVLA